jgi:hypothetical protein
MECRSSFAQQVGAVVLFALAVVLIVYGIGVIPGWSVPPVPVRAAGWVGVILLALVIPTVRPLFASRAVVILNDVGIDDARIGLGLIPWRDMESVSCVELRGRPQIQFWLRDESSYLERWALWRRVLAKAVVALGYSPFSMNLSGISSEFEPVYSYIKRFVTEREPEPAV